MFRDYLHNQACIALLAIVLASIGLVTPALAGGSDGAHAAAGTRVHNTAVVSYVMAGRAHSAAADNTFVVDQLLDVAVTWQDGSPVAAPAGSAARDLLFRITNTGNGSDRYALTSRVTPDAGNGFTASGCQLYLDSDHDGNVSAHDTPYPAPNDAPALAGGASMDILAVCAIPAGAADQSLSHVALSAVSTTLTGQPGTAQTDAHGMTRVVGASGNEAAATGTYAASNVNYAFTSTQLVTDRAGGHVATPGSRITYTLTVTPQGAATGRNLVVNTPIPAHTTYVPGSLELDGTPLGDAATDGDAGSYDASVAATHVVLGNVAGTSAPHHIRFQVTIN